MSGDAPILNLMVGDETSDHSDGEFSLQDFSLQGCPLTLEQLSVHCRAALLQQPLLDISSVEQIEVSVQMLDTAQMQALNAQYRHKDAPTNVLSFESGLPVLHDDDNGSLQVLGDLIFCPAVIAAEASEQNKSLDTHWAHLVVHGTLHLCGYDHCDPTEALSMETLEIAILSKAGIANPYLTCVLND